MKEEIKEIIRLIAEGGYHQRSIKEMQEELEKVIAQLLSTQEEKIFKQLETIDIKMGDPDAEAKVKFGIKAMIRHIKLKNATK